jgi:Protein of unknown function (DUF1353)
MSRFTQKDEPLGRYLPGGKLWRSNETIVYEVGGLGSGVPITVPEGFITDWASIPRFAQLFIPKDVGRRAAVVHDYLYSTHGEYGRWTRKECDRVFLEAMACLEVPWVARHIMYVAVRAGGWVPWNKTKPE